VDKTTTLNDAQNEKSNSSANEAQKTRPFSFLGLPKVFSETTESVALGF